MTKYNTNVARSYGMTAGFRTVWSGVRELIQNALDGQDQGYPMSISYGKARDRSGEFALKIVNEGVVLDRNALVLGFSDKGGLGSNARGKHGEGLVVGINALLNLGCQVWVRTGQEAWIPFHDDSDGLEKLFIDIRKQPKMINDLHVEVKGITPEDWEEYQNRVLDLIPDVKRISVERGEILTESRFRNKLFVKGIYVSELPDKYVYGYNLNKLDLNRDREVANPWDLRYEVNKVIGEAAQLGLISVERLYEIFSDDGCGESRAIVDYSSIAGDVSRKITEHFLSKHGDNALPVTSLGEENEAAHFGFGGVHVSRSLQTMLQSQMGTNEEKMKSRHDDVVKTYSRAELSEDEWNNLMWAVNLVSQDPDYPWFSLNNVSVVDFRSEGTMGTFNKDTKAISLAKRYMGDRAELLTTIAHEVAHQHAGDGEFNHEVLQLRILSRIASRNID
jgi:hypothetical protein